MRLLICTHEYYPHGSGIANVAYNVVEQLKNNGVECTVCSPTGPDIEIKPIGGFGRLSIIHFWYKISKYFMDKKNNFDIAWYHYPLFINKNPFNNCLTTIHSTAYGNKIQGIKPNFYYNFFSKIEKVSFKKIKNNKFVAVDENVCNELIGLGISKDQIRYIPNGVDTTHFKPTSDQKLIRKKYRIPENDLVILSLGRIIEQKQPEKLIKIFSKINEKIKDVTLVIAGNGTLLERTKTLASEMRLNNIIFLGYVDYNKDVPNLYSCSDYYIMTSKYEGQPLTLLEAMSSGLPCIVSDINNFRYIENEKCGITVDYSNIDRASEVIIRYLNDNNSNHSKNARNYAIKKIDWRIIANKYLEVFNKMLKDDKQ
jgi:glycosyltransferase involved in cell wall biosynthesis